MKRGFVPISLEKYVELHLKDTNDQGGKELTDALVDALDAYKHGVKCACGDPIWVIGSALAGYACFSHPANPYFEEI